MHGPDSSELAVFESRLKILKMLAIGVGFVIAAIALIALDFSDTRRGGAAPFVGWLALLFFGPITLRVLWRLAVSNRSPVLRITDEGLHEQTFGGRTFISWSEVESIGVVTSHNNDFAVATVRDPEQLKRRRNRIQRLLYRANPWGDFVMGDGTLSMSAHDLAEEMEERRRRFDPAD